MNRLAYILSLGLLFACNSEDAGDCFQTTGNIIQQEVVVTAFEKILVNRDIELIVIDDLEFKVVIETGENLLNDVEATVVDNQLQLTDNNSCNYVREYNITKIYVTAPNITEIRSSTQYDISSEGILNYNNLSLLSEDFGVLESFTNGDFRMEVNTSKLNIVANGLASFYVSGFAENTTIGFFAGSGRFEGENLIAQHVDISHRGSNDMIVNPQQSLIGVLRGTGDLISKNMPPVVEVEQLYTGRLIFN
jgi:hypothetical protein